MSADLIIFLFSALVAVFGAVMMIMQKNPVASVMFLILSLIAQAVCYVQLGAMFLGAVLVIVYAGAIMVLFLFVIMLLNLRGREDLGLPTHPLRLSTKFFISLLMGTELVMVANSVFMPSMTTGILTPLTQQTDFGSVAQVAKLLFTKYMYPFQLTGVLLLVAVVGAVVIARTNHPEDENEMPAEQPSGAERPPQRVGR